MKFKGAEATVEIDEEVTKKRTPKEYRNQELDKRLREERTSKELKNLDRASKYGARVPSAEKLDESTLKLEKIDGKPVKSIIKQKPEIMEDVGLNVGKIHSADLIHGDLTTSNILIDEETSFLIDFGLSTVSERIEDKAVDIHLLKQVLRSSHPQVEETAWKSFLEGYKEYSESEEVLNQLEDVESRGRYK